MNDILFGIIFILLVLGMCTCIFFVLFVPRKKINMKAFYRRGSVIKKRKKRVIKKVVVILPEGEEE